MTVQEWIKANIKAGGPRSTVETINAAKRCARACGVSCEEARSVIRGGGAPAPAPLRRGKTLDCFRQQYDIKLRIRQGISTHLKSVYMTDQEFREACGVPSSEWRRYADESEFDGNRAKIRGVTYWASAKMVEQMKEIAGVV